MLAAAPSMPSMAQRNGQILAYVGSYNGAIGSGGNGQGIYLFRMDLSTGVLTLIKVASTVPSPSWMQIDPSGKYLYTVNEISNFNGTTSGSVSAFSINRSTGDLTFLNVVSSQGAGPAFLSVDPLGKFVFVANYGGGSVAVLPIESNGSLGNATDVKVDTGSVGPTRATDAPPGSFAISGHDAPHAHMIQADPAGKFVFSTDLGQDRIYSWVLNRSMGTLSPNSPPYVPVPPGDGPRHFAFHPNGRFFYSIQEEASTIIFFDYDAAHGTLTQQQMVSTLPPGFVGTNFTSEIRISADGKFLYGANRLHDSIATFSVGPDGRLTRVSEVWTRGDYPRSFTIDPTDSFLVSCNQRSDALTTYRVHPGNSHSEDPHAGTFVFTGQYTPVGSPAIIIFLT
ncbi:MAG TPA: lactonase family protein [Bryobacteraceae bacterium]|nr:lactonase family protein [Bryobacteraceae bacterium]